MIRVSHSKIKTWRTCHKSFDYKYNQKLQRKRKARPLVFGSIVHEMIDAHANGANPWRVLGKYDEEQGKMFREEVDEYGDIIQDIMWIMEEFFKTYKDDPLEYKKINGVKAEIPFEVEISNGITLIGYIDGFVENKEDKTKWIMEHKTFTNLPSEEERWKSNQAFIYDAIIEIMGWGPADGVIFDYIRSRPPTYPKMTMTGKISRIDSLVTLPIVFEDFLGNNNLDPKKYASVFERLEQCVDQYFQRFYVPIQQSAKKIAIDDLITTSHEIIERGETDHTMNVGRHCSWCDFKLLCEARLKGSDEDFVREHYYETKVSQKTSAKRTKRKTNKRKTTSRKRRNIR